MKQGWEIKKLGQVCDIINGRNQKMVECVDGAYPIYGSGGIMGYASQFLCKAGTTIIGRKGTINKPIYVEEPFWNVDTAFGFQPKSTLNSKLLYYFCLHFDFLKLNKGTTIPSLVKADLLQIDMPYTPSIAEQQRIVEILDREFEKIDALKANAERSLQQAKDLFQSALKQELQPKEGWKKKTINELSEQLFAGGDVPKNAMSKTKTEEYDVPIYANAVENNGLYGYTNMARVYTPSITIAGRGSGTGYVIERTEPYLPVVRLIVIVPQESEVKNRFLYYALKSLNIKSNGSAIPQLTVPMIAQYSINYPKIELQDYIIKKLDILNEHCKALDENYTKTMALCDDIKQALLRQAFNGEL